jgi:dTDP-4-amino-4,6-dideoxygalactose transaminase
MQKPKRVSSASPSFDGQSIEGILRDVKSTLEGGLLADGCHTRDLEKEFAQYIHVQNAIAVSSGTAALEILLRLYNAAGKEVIVPTNTFVATPTAVLLTGGKLVFADIREDTLCIDLDDVKKKVTPKTSGVIVVHIAGLICPQINELRKFCHDNDLFLIEDAAHAHGAKIDGQMAGSLCDGGAFSFYPTKVMTTGQGGIITINDSQMAKAAYTIRDHGLDSERKMVMFGDNWCMSEITAIVGKYQLAKLEDFVCKRNEIAKYYQGSLKEINDVSTFNVPINIRHSYYKYPIRLSDSINRDKVAQIMKADFCIDTGSIYYPPCHLHPWYKENFGTREGDFPVSESVLKQVLCLPMHMGITQEIAQYVVEALKASIESI